MDVKTPAQLKRESVVGAALALERRFAYYPAYLPVA
jgi:hypothetical protein